MTITDWIQAVSMVVLAIITGIYAWRTHVISKSTEKQAEATKQQAEASVKMAEEMREQRYDAVRPIIDMQWEHSTDTRALGEAASLEPEQLSHYESDGLKCILHNIGLGPAIDMYSFVQVSSGERQRCEFGTLAIGEKTISRHLSLKSEGNRIFLRAYYKDIYGRTFESSRDIIILKERSRALGPLRTRLVDGGNSS